MLHGNPTWSFYYRQLDRRAARLAPRHRARPHRLRAARTSPTIRATTTRWRAGSTTWRRCSTTSALDRDMTLVLHDWGGMIGMAYAARHPERIARLVVLQHGGVPPARRAKPLPPALWRLPQHAAGRVLVRGLNALLPGHGRGSAASDGRCRATSATAYLAPYDSWEQPDRRPPLRPGHSAAARRPQLRPGHPDRRTGLGLLDWSADADRLGHEGFRLRPPLPRRMAAAVSRSRGPPLSRRRPLRPRGRSARRSMPWCGRSWRPTQVVREHVG